MFGESVAECSSSLRIVFSGVFVPLSWTLSTGSWEYACQSRDARAVSADQCESKPKSLLRENGKRKWLFYDTVKLLVTTNVRLACKSPLEPVVSLKTTLETGTINAPPALEESPEQ